MQTTATRREASLPSSRGRYQLKDAPNETFAFRQCSIRLLTLKETKGAVWVNLLRYGNGRDSFTTQTTWRLPFKLKNIRQYLMNPYLNQEEGAELTAFFRTYASQQFKFEKLMKFRLDRLVASLNDDTPDYMYKALTKRHVIPSRSLVVLNDEYHPSFQNNELVQEILTKNSITISV